MGNQSSRPKHDRAEAKSHGALKPLPVPIPASTSTAAPTDEVASTTVRLEQPQPAPPAPPQPPQQQSSAIQVTAPPPDLDHIPPSQTQRPPRLPLPIEEEVYTPGSPIISPADITSALNQDPLEAGLPRRSSLLSSTTADDDDVGDELQAYGVDPGVKRAVPTLVEWKGQGDKVYVTGTFAGWNKKFRLHRK